MRTDLLSLPLILALTGCQVFDTRGAETANERGKKSFDPYVGARSGAVRLGLQHFKGCAIYATGQAVPKGNAPIPYPAVCPTHPAIEGNADALGPMPLVTGTEYFLGQIALMDEITDGQLDPSNTKAAYDWITTQSAFAGLDWSGLAATSDRTYPAEGGGPGVYAREVMFGNSAWQGDFQDQMLVELLDSGGTVRATQVYARLDFLAENPTAGHTKVAWTLSNLGKPEFPGDIAYHPPPPQPPTAPPVGPLSTQTVVRIERAISTVPTKTITVPAGLDGDGAFRVTWSALPSKPFYFPVRFTAAEALPQSCFDAAGAKVACTFGLAPDAVFSTPQNGTHYLPGEAFNLRIAARDGAGNLLHRPEALPSWKEYLEGKSNGLMLVNLAPLVALNELDSIAGLALAGPLQDMRFYYDEGQSPWLHTADFVTQGFTDSGNSMIPFPTFAAAVGVLPGAREAPLPTDFRFKVPANAKPGTYVAEVKLHRQFAGERVTKAVPFYFQVGQAEPTKFPGRVGNCQLCHRGVISLDNVRHGLPVDFVEGCKTCHNRDEPAGGKIVEIIHQLHMNSPKYPAQKTDCATCHLTRESTVRPSLAACGACHPSAHGDQFFQMSMVQSAGTNEPNKFSNCAQQCHGTTLPKAHLVPER